MSLDALGGLRRPEGAFAADQSERQRALILVIAGAVVVIALARFMPKIGGYALLALVIGMLALYFQGRA